MNIERNKTDDCVEEAFLFCNEMLFDSGLTWLHLPIISSFPLDVVGIFRGECIKFGYQDRFGYEEIALDLCSENFIEEMNEAFNGLRG